MKIKEWKEVNQSTSPNMFAIATKRGKIYLKSGWTA